MDLTNLQEQLEYWEGLRADAERAKEYAEIQIHRVRVAIGMITVEAMQLDLDSDMV